MSVPVSHTTPAAISGHVSSPGHQAFVPREVPRLPYGVVLQWPVRFDGTPAGYARVWLGNVLIVLLTLGLAWPWTYRRSQRYLLRHTEVAGHRLDFRLPPRVLWPRMLVTVVLWGGVAVAAMGSPWAGLLALAMCGAVWPLLIYLKVLQRVSSVAWGGRRLWFDGPWQGVYRATLVTLVLGVSTLCSALLSWHGHLQQGWWMTGALVAAWLLYLPVRYWNLFQYRQHHIRLGPMRLLWQGTRVAMLGVFARVAVWMLLVMSLVGGVALMGVGGWLLLHRPVSDRGAIVCGVLAGVVVLSLVVPYLEARLINLVWNKTGNRYLRFRSQVPVGPYVRQRALNVWGVILSLGLYWPWAVISNRRLRMQSLVVWSRVEPEVLLAHWPCRESDVPPPALPVSTLMPDGPGLSTQPSFVSRFEA